MPVAVRCNSCNQVFRVAESLIGKRLTCPECQATFKAVEEKGHHEDGPVAHATVEPAQDVEPELRPPARQPWPDDEEERAQRRMAFQSASAKVMGPAIGLIAVGGLGLLVGLLYLFIAIVDGPRQIAQMEREMFPDGVPAAQRRQFEASAKVGLWGFISVFHVWSFLVISSGVQMLRLRTYSFAMIGSIIVMLPCNFCCVLGLPFGIWALVVLNDPMVKSAFR